ncbi:hypothetical protein KFE98_05915 [bacterium SCSIO 12741]|nr:hypothetical protein KFE98_05915 [bacterium SCSIO 12741]
MENWFIHIQRYFSRKKALFFGLLLLLMALLGGLVSQLRFEENISRMLPGSEELVEVNRLIESSGFMDRLFIHVYADGDVHPDSLTELADQLAERLSDTSYQGLIRTFEYQLTDEDQQAVYNYLSDNLPYFLSEKDYRYWINACNPIPSSLSFAVVTI